MSGVHISGIPVIQTGTEMNEINTEPEYLEPPTVPYEWASSKPTPARRRAYYYVTGKLWRWYPPSGGWLHPVKWYREAKWFVQRGWRGWADCDAWGLDTYVARVLCEGMRNIEKNANGTPGMFVTWDDEKEMPAEGTGEADHERWKAWLREKADWLEWYYKDEDGSTGDTNWIDRSLSEEERCRRIDAHTAKMKIFHEEVMLDIGRKFSCLWD